MALILWYEDEQEKVIMSKLQYFVSYNYVSLYLTLQSTYPTVMASPEFLSVTKLLAMVVMTGSMVCRCNRNEFIII